MASTRTVVREGLRRGMRAPLSSIGEGVSFGRAPHLFVGAASPSRWYQSTTARHYLRDYIGDGHQGQHWRSFSNTAGALSSHVDDRHHPEVGVAMDGDGSSTDEALSSLSSSSAAQGVDGDELDEREYDPGTAADNVWKAAFENFPWDPTLNRSAMDNYERHLRYVLQRLRSAPEGGSDDDDGDDASEGARGADENDDGFRSVALRIHPDATLARDTERLLGPRTTSDALKCLLGTKVEHHILARRVRALERLVGSIGLTPLTDKLSLRLVEANGKAGNVGRTLALLNLRKSRRYPPDDKEFAYAVQSIKSAQHFLLTKRNVFIGDGKQPALDNPTRWLDAILVNMSDRRAKLTTKLANRMLNTYAGAGRSGKALHYFYRTVRHRVDDDRTCLPGPHPTDLSRDELEAWRASKIREVTALGGSAAVSDDAYEAMPRGPTGTRPVKVRLAMRSPPPYHKVPSRVRDQKVKRPGKTERVTKMKWESDRDWSLPLTSAFAFADSLTHGACGHDPIELDIWSWNILIKACCYRGALWRAFQILDEVMPAKGIEPNTCTYNTILAGLARVGDVESLKELLVTMTNKGIPPDKFTVEAIVDGLLNVGDIGGASTVVQDMFNQHNVLPPYTSHLKIIEFALGNGLVHEGKRHVYFIQQLWKWQPTNQHPESFKHWVEMTKNNPRLSKVALQKLFHYFGEELTEADFF